MVPPDPPTTRVDWYLQRLLTVIYVYIIHGMTEIFIQDRNLCA